ncbi:NurA domain protein [Methanocaldococcus infernus ME]|uniref:NurA domain protein n=1 Tax=Methanocaldococcus infernus (strain DSM 11812 / JCM 15783 / ME) TaxID=573063 RepID=D5VSC4_METIM|nr:DNA double-strand break repair nuclease NurA [Methanocaldococcus infernus]ADG13477.1 NurA domain protein [Methanocaldococcus infernus ME]
MISKENIERIVKVLKEDLRRYEEELKHKKIEWNELPQKKECKCYAVDGSLGRERLSGTILYSVASYAFGCGKSKYLSHTNALIYNYRISDQIIRLQMETLENKLAYFVGDSNYLIFMDGTLTGSLTRPPVYPECIEGIKTINKELGESKLKEMIKEFIELLDSHYLELEDKIKENKKVRENTILSDNILENFEEYYREMSFNLEESREIIHVVLNYLEYLYSLDKVLNKKLVYVAKSFYSRVISEKLDIPLIELYILKNFNEEKEGYFIPKERAKVSHRLPEAIEKYFPNINKYINLGVPLAFIRAMKGGYIFNIQSNLDIDEELISNILSHVVSGYIYPLKKAHEGVKIEKRWFDELVRELTFKLKKEGLGAYIKYGRYILE